MATATEAGPPPAVSAPASRETPLDPPFEVPADPLPVGLLPDGDDVIDLRPAVVRILARHYADRGWTVVSGSDFEENLLHAEHAAVERREWDDYVRIKLGRSRPSARARDYARAVRGCAGSGTVGALLSISRLCTYAGGPGFADLVLLGDGLSLRAVVVEEWTREQKLFAFLASLAGIEVRAAGPGAPVRFIPRNLLDSILADPRARAMTDGLEGALAREREWLGRAAPAEVRRAQDEIEALETERFRSPFHLLGRWLDRGAARWRDVETHRDLLRASHRARISRFGAAEAELRRDPGFASWTGNPSPEELAALAEAAGNRFGFGETRTKAFLLYLKDSAAGNGVG